MQYTKSMIDLVFQIRKTAPAEVRPYIKLTNPDLFDYLVDIYSRFEEGRLRKLVKQLLTLAGPAWLELLAEGSAGMRNTQGNARMYRGQVVDALEASPEPQAQPATKKREMTYRGQKIQAS